jgi:hypothetical protein
MPYAACLTCVLVLSVAAPARAGQANEPAQVPPSAPAAPNVPRPGPVEIDYRLVNLPTTVPLPRFRSNLQITHRFAGNLRRGGFGFQLSNLFGLDQGAMVGFEYRLAIIPRVQAAIYRVTLDKTFQFHGQFEAWRQGASLPVSISAVVSVEGVDNFKDQYAPAVGAVVSRTFADVVAAYASPMWVNNTAAVLGVDRHTAFLGLGVRVRVRPSLFVVSEVAPRVDGYAPSDPEFAVALEKRMGGHVFQINVTNTTGTTYGQTARGGSPETLYLGFNLSRKF